MVIHCLLSMLLVLLGIRLLILTAPHYVLRIFMKKRHVCAFYIYMLNTYSIFSDSLPNEVTDHLTQQTNQTNEIKLTNRDSERNSRNKKIIVLPIPSS